MSRRTRPFFPATLLVLALPLLGGCVERTLQVTSEPSGALVYLNGEEVGRTPMRKDFLWYGTYDVELRKEGYETKVAEAKVWAPWWQIPPIDLFAELIPLPLQDNHAVSYTLDPVSPEQVDPQRVIDRAVQLRGRLRSSPHTRQPAPTTAPATTQSVD
jgi:PEGA domain